MSYELVVTDDFGMNGYVFRRGDVVKDETLHDEIERSHPNRTVRRALVTTPQAPAAPKDN